MRRLTIIFSTVLFVDPFAEPPCSSQRFFLCELSGTLSWLLAEINGNGFARRSRLTPLRGKKKNMHTSVLAG